MFTFTFHCDVNVFSSFTVKSRTLFTTHLMTYMYRTNTNIGPLNAFVRTNSPSSTTELANGASGVFLPKIPEFVYTVITNNCTLRCMCATATGVGHRVLNVDSALLFGIDGDGATARRGRAELPGG